ncbi:peptidase C1B, bleomycin hydrolase [Metschnikowia bicuspidata var. bicuspidata NRRL YB-4993]|uniref:Cysteine proteinase 1, mitochondrial n=1 Tax=Metschnikowia bicuspidata var. bicuspidata NRRL YB-4993 TaxID=869754 RepID=A0A1A0HFJ1_9ASCO|nr:peptidase C1B, bleomycin hydrolase [Metschnikowia bicuspidata var. bicuspidata NRRL YB-4993]OBA22667.1 peptidase C1B, bleomycin hydrolase [Metschnikowia bicuspidata var. bicuspidata NRRL YB-4993]
MPLSVSSLEQWSAAMATDLHTQLGASVLANFNADEALIDRATVIKNTTSVFNTKIAVEGAPVTNQKASGRCWLFAAGNVLRVPLMAKLALKEFQFSQSYWFFYDKLEKCNFFLEQFAANIDSTPAEGLDSRLNLYLLTDPTCDGGQFDMFINVVEKYGMVPYDAYPDAYSATASRTLNFMLKTKLREFAEILRGARAQGAEAVVQHLAQMQREIHRLMVMFLGQPPHPDQHMTWDYKDKDDHVQVLEFTPMLMYKKVVGVDLTQWVSLLNDPRNPYECVVRIDKLGNVSGGKLVSYLNVDIDTLAAYAVQRIQNNHAVFFGTHTPIYMDKKRGIMDEGLFNYKLVGFESLQSKASRIEYQPSLMTHAMVLTAVHLDKLGNPVRWRVENSWGKDSGQDGYYVMDHQYFRDYVYQIVTEKAELEEKHQDALLSEPVVLPPWDPMGALATFQNEPEMVA